ncbi:MAG: hypothetical protein QXL86_01360, partial [Candidatus Aenigmatarchaeota archaeon]
MVRRMKSKGMVFSLEAILATSLLLSVFMFLSILTLENVSPYKRFERLNIFAKDSLEVMSKIKVGSLIDEVDILKELYKNGKIEDNETSVLELIGALWVSGDAENASNVAKAVLEKTMPSGVNYKLMIEGKEVYTRSITPEATELSQSTMYVSGFESERVIKGFTARAFLEKIKSQLFSSYVYFGGFVGQGNISLVMKDIPSEAIPKSIYIEANIGDDFDFYVNGVFCKRIVKTSFSGIEPEKIEIKDENCINSIKPGETNFFQLN